MRPVPVPPLCVTGQYCSARPLLFPRRPWGLAPGLGAHPGPWNVGCPRQAPSAHTVQKGPWALSLCPSGLGWPRAREAIYTRGYRGQPPSQSASLDIGSCSPDSGAQRGQGTPTLVARRLVTWPGYVACSLGEWRSLSGHSGNSGNAGESLFQGDGEGSGPVGRRHIPPTQPADLSSLTSPPLAQSNSTRLLISRGLPPPRAPGGVCWGKPTLP